MKNYRKLELQQKGWSNKDIKKAEDILEKEEKHDTHFSKIVFWSALVVIIFANVLVSLILIPFLIVLNKWMLYITIIILAGTIGFLYNFLIMDIGHLKKKHHLLASIIIPLLAIINIIVVIFVSNQFIKELKIDNIQHNPFIASLVFVIAFILPYIVDKIRRKIKEN